MKTERLSLHNDAGEAKRVILEPWGMELSLPPGRSLELELTGPEPGSPEVEDAPDGTICVYGWRGTTVVARQDGAIVYDTRGMPTPSPPGSLSMALEWNVHTHFTETQIVSEGVDQEHGFEIVTARAGSHYLLLKNPAGGSATTVAVALDLGTGGQLVSW